jgi:hypothetical protein
MKPTYKTQFVKNREYDGITRTNPGQLRFRIPSSSSSYYNNNNRRGGGMFNFFGRKNKGYDKTGIFNFFGKKKKGYNDDHENNNAELKRQIQAKYKQNGITDEYLFEYFKGRPHYDQINLNRFMNKYIPLSMRKKPTKKQNVPVPKPTPVPPPVPKPTPVPPPVPKPTPVPNPTPVHPTSNLNRLRNDIRTQIQELKTHI